MKKQAPHCTIETKRLVLRPPARKDDVPLSRAIEESLASLEEGFSFLTLRKSCGHEERGLSPLHSFKQLTNASIASIPVLAFSRAGRALVGAGGLYDPKIGPKGRRLWIEMWFWIRQSMCGRGFACELAEGLTRFALDELRFEEVWIAHPPGREASANIARKLGFFSAGGRNDRAAEHGYAMCGTGAGPNCSVYVATRENLLFFGANGRAARHDRGLSVA